MHCKSFALRLLSRGCCPNLLWCADILLHLLAAVNLSVPTRCDNFQPAAPPDAGSPGALLIQYDGFNLRNMTKPAKVWFHE
eukprot:6675961-Prymnesium_polylepis.1